MKITHIIENNIITIFLEGSLNTNTSSILSDELNKIIPKNKLKINLIMDFKKLEYISSAGLRVLLSTQKRINDVVGTMIIRNVNPTIMEVFELTGFSDFLTIE